MVLENALGYSGWIDNSMQNETAMPPALSQKKHAFKEYTQLFPECREVIAKKREERLKKSNRMQQQHQPLCQFNLLEEVLHQLQVYAEML